LGKGETEDGTMTTENMRCAATRVSWSGWTIAKSNWWKSASGNTWQVWQRISCYKEHTLCVAVKINSKLVCVPTAYLVLIRQIWYRSNYLSRAINSRGSCYSNKRSAWYVL
jgi:hypothetical protein